MGKHCLWLLFAVILLYGCTASFMSATEKLPPDEAYDYYKAQARESTSMIDFAYRVFDAKYLKSETQITDNSIRFKYSGKNDYEARVDRTFNAYCEVKYAGVEHGRDFCFATVDNTTRAYIVKQSAGADGSYVFKTYTENKPKPRLKTAVKKEEPKRDIEREITQAKNKVVSYTANLTPVNGLNIEYTVSANLDNLTRLVRNNSKSAYIMDLDNTGDFANDGATYAVLHKIITQTKEVIVARISGCARSGNTVLVNPGMECEVELAIEVPGLYVKRGEPLILVLNGGTYLFTTNTKYSTNKAYYDDLAKNPGQ